MVDYYCDGPGATVLLRGIDRSHPVWTVQTGHGGDRPSLGPVATIRTAWYGAD